MNADNNRQVNKKSLNTSICFITDDKEETDFIDNISEKASDKAFLKKENLTKANFKHISKGNVSNKKSKRVNEALADLNSETADTICLNYDVLKKNTAIKFTKAQVDKGKTVLFYGDNIDLVEFCKKFGLEKNIPNDNINYKTENVTVTDPEDDSLDINSKPKRLVSIGLEKKEWGYTLIQSLSNEYNFHKVVNGLFLNAKHAKKVKENKPFLKENRKGTKNVSIQESIKGMFIQNAYADPIDDYPIVDDTRFVSDFDDYANWHLITDCYLHKLPDEESGTDYFILETISEFDPYYDEDELYINTGDRFYSKLESAYSSDTVRAGAPDDQSATYNITIGVPPLVEYQYQPGGKVSTNSFLTLSGNYFRTYYYSEDSLGSGFLGEGDDEHETIFIQQLSYKVVGSPSKIYITQRMRNKDHHDQNEYAFDEVAYYYRF